MRTDEKRTRHPITRRRFLQAATVAASGVAGLASPACRDFRLRARDYNPLAEQARVTILHASSYDKNLSDLLRQGMKNHALNVRGKRVVLKPNLVEYHAAHRINTNPLLVAAAIDCFRALGAAEVIVADGPGHQRDTEMLLELSGLDEVVRGEKARFVDLNTDSIHRVETATHLAKLGELWLPETILGADLVVSMPKMKTHHWAGVTLSLKNLFGVIPSVRYGWPKNVLHWHGIDESIVDIATTVRPGFTIIDGIEGMEGNGPLHGETVNSQVIVMSENLAAADATAARLMGLDPLKVVHLSYMRDLGAPVAARRITQAGERLADYRREFRLLDSFAHLRT
ncbi:MAG TPA: DUF362 domain-containing protein [Blastocatellia bacterium]|nr:DUF362 domain-containing protein [Blastocatellia bacterium]